MKVNAAVMLLDTLKLLTKRKHLIGGQGFRDGEPDNLFIGGHGRTVKPNPCQ